MRRKLPVTTYQYRMLVSSAANSLSCSLEVLEFFKNDVFSVLCVQAY